MKCLFCTESVEDFNLNPSPPITVQHHPVSRSGGFILGLFYYIGSHQLGVQINSKQVGPSGYAFLLMSVVRESRVRRHILKCRFLGHIPEQEDRVRHHHQTALRQVEGWVVQDLRLLLYCN